MVIGFFARNGDGGDVIKSNLHSRGIQNQLGQYFPSGVVIFENTADLCPACAEKMRHAINPANWPRIDPAVRQFAKKSAT